VVRGRFGSAAECAGGARPVRRATGPDWNAGGGCAVVCLPRGPPGGQKPQRRHTSISALAVAERIDRGYLGRVVQLALLAPDIVEAILDGREPDDLGLPGLMEPFPAEWPEQRRAPLNTGAADCCLGPSHPSVAATANRALHDTPMGLPVHRCARFTGGCGPPNPMTQPLAGRRSNRWRRPPCPQEAGGVSRRGRPVPECRPEWVAGAGPPGRAP